MRRREFLRLGAAALAGTALGCGGRDPIEPTFQQKLGKLSARPGSPSGSLFVPGKHALGIADRDAYVYLPPGHDASVPAPLVALFHGAGGSVDSWATPYAHADRLGLVLLIAQSQDATWDLVRGGYGVDVATLDRALEITFSRCAIDAAAVTFLGFSDGASYALSLGTYNGDLVSRAVAFSAGFWEGLRSEPKPRIFMSHGTADPILPIDATGRVIADELRGNGYDLTFVEFDGGHEVPPEISEAAFDWIAAA